MAKGASPFLPISVNKSSIRHLHISIMHLVCPPKFYITFVFHFSWVLQSSQEKLKTMLMQNFGGQVRCIMGDVAYGPFLNATSYCFKANLNAKPVM